MSWMAPEPPRRPRRQDPRLNDDLRACARIEQVQPVDHAGVDERFFDSVTTFLVVEPALEVGVEALSRD